MDFGDCPIRNVMADFGDKWSLLVFGELILGQRRFSELLNAMPDISQRMLTQTLRKHERSGFIRRTVTPTSPPRVDYALTELGQSLVVRLMPVSEWATENLKAIKNAQLAYDNSQPD
ncbi:winged helix-turn-helix transcriptional regulator [Roseobacteraceae bacterium S113]